MIERYANNNGRSGIVGYEIGDDQVVIHYSDSSCYRYSCGSCGRQLLEEMKVLARRGEGLNRFINKYVGKKYESRWRPY